MLDRFRRKIDAVDGKIISLLEKRDKISRAIGKYKKRNKIPVRDIFREKEIVKNVIKKTSLEPKFIKSLYKIIFKFSRKVQK